MKKSRKSARRAGAVEAVELQEPRATPRLGPPSAGPQAQDAVRITIHTLAPIPARSWTIAATAERPAAELKILPLSECAACRKKSGWPYLSRRCRDCGEESLFLLAVSHDAGGIVLCARCITTRALSREC